MNWRTELVVLHRADAISISAYASKPCVAAIQAFAFAAFVLVSSSDVKAFDECGPAVANNVSCTGDGAPAGDANPYPNGIRYQIANLTLSIDGTASPILMSVLSGNTVNSGNGVLMRAAGAQVLRILGNVSINVIGSTFDRDGVLVESNDGKGVDVESTANISVSNLAGDAIVARSGVTPSGSITNTGGTVSVTSSGAITTFGSGTAGITAQSSGTIKVSAGQISTAGPLSAVGIATRSSGLSAADKTEIAVGGTISTIGASSAAVAAQSDAGSILVTNASSIRTGGVSSPSIALRSTIGGNLAILNSGIIRADNSSAITASSSNQFTLLNTGSISSGSGVSIDTTVFSSTTKDLITSIGGLLEGDVLLGANVDKMLISGGSFTGALFMGADNDEAEFAAQTAMAGVTGLNGGTGTDTLVLNNVTYTGGSQVSEWEQITLQNGSSLNLNSNLILGDAGNSSTPGTLTGALTINNTSSLSLSGGSNRFIQAIGAGSDVAVVNAGLIDLTFGASAPSDTLTIAGNYSGQNGRLAISTVLGGDSSATDKLSITGTTAGTTTVRVTNAGGTGAQTSAGIKVITVGGASSGTFALEGDYEFQGDQAVVGGAYAYRLYQGTVGVADGDWYLRSTLLKFDITNPLYQPGVPVYESYANILSGYDTLGTLQQRMGGRTWLGQLVSNEAAVSSEQAEGIWGRTEAAYGKYDPAYSTSGANYSVDQARFQAGIDHIWLDTGSGQLVGGININYGSIGADIDSVFGQGSVRSDAIGVGGTVTWYDRSGFYLDGQANLTWFNSDLMSDTAASILASNNSGLSYGLSLEAGQELALSGTWSITPQVQISYRRANFEDFSDRFNAQVASNGSANIVGRLGTSIDFRNEWITDRGNAVSAHIYGIGNLLYDFADETRTTVGEVEFLSETKPLRGQLGVGSVYAWGDDKYLLYGEVSLATSLENVGAGLSLAGNVGLRVKW